MSRTARRNRGAKRVRKLAARRRKVWAGARLGTLAAPTTRSRVTPRAKHRHAVGGERVTGCAKVRDAFADVGAEAEVALQLPSFQTSTETSSTGRGIGGSGLDARTVTASAP